jgi:hypothetical protein
MATATDCASSTLNFIKHDSCSGTMTFGNARSVVSVSISLGCFNGDEEMERSAAVFRRLLAGERNLSATIAGFMIDDDAEDNSKVSISDDDTFELVGGVDGPTFGGMVSISVPYSENKATIDAFLAFMLENVVAARFNQ